MRRESSAGRPRPLVRAVAPVMAADARRGEAPCAAPIAGVAAGLSIIPGLGQLYNGQPRKALYYFLWTLCTIGPAILSDRRRAVDAATRS